MKNKLFFFFFGIIALAMVLAGCIPPLEEKGGEKEALTGEARSTGRARASCGDGVIASGEACDDRNSGNNDGCSSCSIDADWSCTGSPSACTRIDGCSNTCTIDAGWFCTEASGRSICSKTICGNGVREPEEQCDDGGTTSGDGCSSTCTTEQGWFCMEAVGRSICSRTTCGNAVLEPGEQCDDGGTVSGDGCSNVCMFESGWWCTEVNGISLCSRTICGNGVIEPGEQCDDGSIS